jgi:hypothetical protein
MWICVGDSNVGTCGFADMYMYIYMHAYAWRDRPYYELTTDGPPHTTKHNTQHHAPLPPPPPPPPPPKTNAKHAPLNPYPHPPPTHTKNTHKKSFTVNKHASLGEEERAVVAEAWGDYFSFYGYEK